MNEYISREAVMNDYISREAVMNITAETEAWETQIRVRELPAADVEPVRRGRWIMREKDKLIATGKIAVSEGHILHKTSFDEPFTLQSANIIQIKEHRTVKIPYCSICGNYGDDEYDKTPYCPNCGTKMEKEVEE